MVPEGRPGVGVRPRTARLPWTRVLAGLEGAARHATTWAVAAAVVCIAAGWPRLVPAPPLVLLDVAIAVGCVVAGNTPMEGGPRSVVPARLAAVAWAFTGAEAWGSPAARWVAVLAMAVFWSALARGCLQLGARRPGTADRAGVAALAACWILLGAPGTSGVVTAALTVLAHAVLVLRCRWVRGASRDAVPLAVVVTVAAVATAIAITVAEPGAARPVTGVGLAATLLVALVPVGTLAAGLRRRQVRAGVAELLMRTASPPSMESVRDAIAVALRDPSASIRYRAAGAGSAESRVGPSPDARDERLSVTARSDAGDAIAVIDCSATARRRPDLLDAVARLSGPAVQNARLHEITLARLDEVRASRSRIVSAALEERRRLERDLHDGAQQRLLAVAARLGLARSKAGGPEALAALDGVREQLRGTLSELRALARDIHPAVLETAGLGAALDVTAGRLDFPLTVDVGSERFDSSTEAVAYLTAHELVVDAARSGAVTAASVAATREGRVLRMVVRHDGGGNARTHAIENATDRLRALGGALSIDTVGGGGVVITADVPCE